MATDVRVSVTVQLSTTEHVIIEWSEHYGRWHAEQWDSLTKEWTRRPDLDKFTYTGVSTLTSRILDHPENVRGDAGIAPRVSGVVE